MTQFLPGIVCIKREPDGVCEGCGNKDELRPYGPKKSDGKRMRVCFDCAMKDEADVDKAIEENLMASLEGRMPPNT